MTAVRMHIVVVNCMRVHCTEDGQYIGRVCRG